MRAECSLLRFYREELSTFGQFMGMNRDISDLGVITGFRWGLSKVLPGF